MTYPQDMVRAASNYSLTFADGARMLLHGFNWLRARPKLLILGMAPAALATVLLLTLLVVLLWNIADLVQYLTPFASDWDTWAMWLTRIVAGLGIVAASAWLCVALSTALAMAIGDPIYQKIWSEVERDIHGEVPDCDLGAVHGVKSGFALAWRSLAVSLVCAVVGVVPFVGGFAATGLSSVASGWFMSVEMSGRTLDAHEIVDTERRAAYKKRSALAIGFGVAVNVSFLIPLGALVFMPSAVVGSTFLAHRIIEAEGLGAATTQ